VIEEVINKSTYFKILMNINTTIEQLRELEREVEFERMLEVEAEQLREVEAEGLGLSHN